VSGFAGIGISEFFLYVFCCLMFDVLDIEVLVVGVFGYLRIGLFLVLS
jgi:hypothetical protein